MSEVDIEVSETEHTVSDINVALIPLVIVSFVLTGGYYILSLLTTHEREPIPSFVDFLELHDCNWPPDSASECIATDDESKSPLEQCSPISSGIGCDGLVGLGVAQESGENGNLPCELVVTTHTPCFPVNAIHKPPRFHHQHVYHWCPRSRMLPAPPRLSTMAATIISASEGATNQFNMLVGSEPAYLNTMSY